MRNPLAAILIAVAAAVVPPYAGAETVSQKQASEIATLFSDALREQRMAPPKLVYNGRKLTTSRLFNPFYVYNLPGGGFVIVAAENKAFPILAFDPKFDFDPDNMSKALKALLTSYALDIELIRYDNRVPYAAVEAWQDINATVTRIVHGESTVTDPLSSLEEVDKTISDRAFGTAAYDLWSDLYDPAQWTEMVDDQLERTGNLNIGIEMGYDILPAIVVGRHGEFYRLATDKAEAGFFRLFATEYMSEGKFGDFTSPVGAPEYLVEEQLPFEFYDSFAAETRADAQSSIEQLVSPPQPLVRNHGSGMYTIDTPQPVVMARVYNLSGAMTTQYQYQPGRSVHISLMDMPAGFYVAILYGADGAHFGVKLVK